MTAVLDASVLAEVLLGTTVGRAATTSISAHSGDLHLPHLAVVETASVFRAWVCRGEVQAPRITAALDDLGDFPARRWPAEPLLERIWDLRANISAYDATYVALAEALDADLLTADARLARGLHQISDCRIVTIAS